MPGKCGERVEQFYSRSPSRMNRLSGFSLLGVGVSGAGSLFFLACSIAACDGLIGLPFRPQPTTSAGSSTPMSATEAHFDVRCLAIWPINPIVAVSKDFISRFDFMTTRHENVCRFEGELVALHCRDSGRDQA